MGAVAIVGQVGDRLSGIESIVVQKGLKVIRVPTAPQLLKMTPVQRARIMLVVSEKPLSVPCHAGFVIESGSVEGLSDFIDSIVIPQSKSSKVQSVYDCARKVAQSNISVFLTGESGAGKEVVAQYLGRASNLKSFVSLNCAAIPDALIESELFGYEKGAFTGAVNSKIGKFELAHNGTLFLDEITEMNASLQAKLLRAIQEGQIDKVGGMHPTFVDVRIVSSSNQDIRAAISSNRFREDLYFRLNGINLHLPPLRERIEDIEDLAQQFARDFAFVENCSTPPTISSSALQVLRDYHWPGNIRELRNVIHRAVLFADGVVRPQDLRL
jgi:transcriptional regulator with PAS, ATPase and Fis domain